MNKIEFIKDNFLGISYSEQQQVLEYLITFLEKSSFKKLSREFNSNFNPYLDKIKLLLEFKVSYKEFNSDKRRLIRKFLLEELQETILYDHHIDNSEIRVKQQFCYSSEYYEEYKKYFDVNPVSTDDVQKFLIDYSNLDMVKKRNFIEEMLFFYQRINYLSLPLPDKMLNDYKPIIQSIIGDELIEYYDCLYTKEKMQLILRLVDEFKWFKTNVNYYNSDFKTLKENPTLIRILKKETIDYCKSKFL